MSADLDDSKRFESSKSKSKNRSERMGSEKSGSSKFVPKNTQSRNDLLHPRAQLSSKHAHTRSNDNLLNTRIRRAKSGERRDVNNTEKDSFIYNIYNERASKREKLSTENYESSDDQVEKIRSSKVYNFEPEEIDEESENVNDANEELTGKGKGSMNNYAPKMHSFGNMFENVQPVTKQEFEELKNEVKRLSKKQDESRDPFMPEIKSEQNSELFSMDGSSKRDSYARPLSDVGVIENSAVGSSMNRARNRRNFMK